MSKHNKGTETNTKIVAFLDILGYKDLMTSWLKDGKIARKIELTLRKSIEWIGGRNALNVNKSGDWSMRIFSDSIYVSVPDNELGLLNIFQGLSYFQRQMFSEGFLIRGGISFGNHFETELTTLSAGLLEAYNIESSKAKYSRIMLSKSLIDKINNMKDIEIRKEIKEYILEDKNKDCFICYLLFEEDDPWFNGAEFYVIHKKLIETMILNKSLSRNVKSKYVWLAKFHNWCLNQTARKIKTNDILNTDDIWDFGSLLIRSVKVSQKSFESLLWLDKSFEKDKKDVYRRKIVRDVNWVTRNNGQSTEDDEDNGDAEPEPLELEDYKKIFNKKLGRYI